MKPKCRRHAFLLGAFLLAAPFAHAEKTAPPELQNPDFQNAGPDGIPAPWVGYPPPKGANQKMAADPAGGIHFTDQDPANGLGLAQWVSVTPGTKYTASATVASGTGSVNLILIFTPTIPPKAAEIQKIKVNEVQGTFSTTQQTPVTAEVPAGAAFMRVFLYSTKPGLCDLTVKSVEVKSDGSAPVTPSPATASSAPAPAHASAHPDNPGVPRTAFTAPEILPPGTIWTIDFETGDFTQCRSLEGGIKEIVSAPEPVREGQHAMKVSLTHDYHRTEMTGPRSAAYGEFKYGWSLYIPKDFDGTSFFSIVSQWHTWGSGKDYPPDGGPPSSISISKNQWSLKIQHQDGNQFKTAHDYFNFGPIDDDRGKWTDFMADVNWQSAQTGGGFFRLYKNGVKVVDYNGPTWFDDKTKGPFFKAGIYKGSREWKGDPSGAILYVDNFRMGDDKASMDDIDPSKPHPPAKTGATASATTGVSK